jgi:hypothetical protein
MGFRKLSDEGGDYKPPFKVDVGRPRINYRLVMYILGAA